METDTEPETKHVDEAIECLVLFEGKRAMMYDEKKKTLSVAKKGFTVFPSRRAANVAVWHQKEFDRAAGEERPWEKYSVVPT